MALEQKLTVKLSQRLIMTPSLQQAIKLLQMSRLDIVEEVNQELVDNPVLEDGTTTDEPERRDGEGPAEASAAGETAESPSETAESAPSDDFDYESYFRDLESGYTPQLGAREHREDLPSFENTLSESRSLAEHLGWQLDMNSSDARRHEIGEAIIGNLDEDGYLRATTEELSCMGDPPYEAGEIEAVRQTLRRFDPVGVASRDLQECLCLQLELLGLEDSTAMLVVRDHMGLLEAHRYREIADALDLPLAEVGDSLEVIRGLDPRPGQKYNAAQNHYVTPDVHVVKLENEYKVLLNEEGLPRLRISPVYRRMVEKGSKNMASAEAREFVREKLRAAFRLIKSLEERQRTIFKVATSIVKFQREFLDHGIERLRPLVLRDVAEDIQMHESTVSRVVNNKYMHTPRGLFEMRFFFHSGIASSRGDDVSSLTVKERIKKIIAQEDSRRPLSDSAIVTQLRREGLQIARRTVAKYRDELGIASSTQRRQVFS
jgi:RNA polymerase sigma-54 factor